LKSPASQISIILQSIIFWHFLTALFSSRDYGERKKNQKPETVEMKLLISNEEASSVGLANVAAYMLPNLPEWRNLTSLVSYSTIWHRESSSSRMRASCRRRLQQHYRSSWDRTMLPVTVTQVITTLRSQSPLITSHLHYMVLLHLIDVTAALQRPYYS